MIRPRRPVRGWTPAALAGLALTLAACQEESSTPVAPTPPAAAPTGQVTASFTATSFEVAEGGTVAIGVRFAGSRLAAPFPLEVRVADGGPGDEDFELSATSIQVPAGEATSGEVQVLLAAAADLRFAEGAETVTLEFAATQAATVRTSFGEAAEVVIADAPVAACPGVLVAAEPVQQELRDDDPPEDHHLATTLRLELDGAGLEAGLDLRSPYLEWRESAREPFSAAAFGVTRWRVERVGRGARHELEINWPGRAWVELRFPPEDSESASASETSTSAPAPGLEIGIVGGACAAETVIGCGDEGCELLQ